MNRMAIVVLAVISCVILATGCGKESVVGPTSNSDTSLSPYNPGNLQATAVSSNQINLTWKGNSGHEDGFEITRTGGGKTVIFYADATHNAVDTTISYSDNGLNSNTAYSYKVRAYGTVHDVPGGRLGYSKYTDEVSTTTK